MNNALPNCPRCDKSPTLDHWEGNEKTYYYYACMACFVSGAEDCPNLVGAAMKNAPDAAKAWVDRVKEFEASMANALPHCPRCDKTLPA